MTKRALTTVERAARRRGDAERAYFNAMRAARADGHTFTAIAVAAGVTRQNVEQVLARERSNEA